MSPSQRGGNFISEWFGHRIYPLVADFPHARMDQTRERCPFLSAVTNETRQCTKAANSRGVCTISSSSNGIRQDWLACPFRALDSTLLGESARRLFGYTSGDEINLVAVTRLRDQAEAEAFRSAVRAGVPSLVYFHAKLGGEINISPTDRSPQFSFDSTMVEVVCDEDGTLCLGRYGIFEIQTMDFHGSYGAATKNLRDALRLHGDQFSSTLSRHPEWASQKVEGPNIANAFKRTFYQMMFKFQIGAHGHSAGCVLAIPAAVWDSWQRHLGKPELTLQHDGTYRLALPCGENKSLSTDQPPAWIYVFDVDISIRTSPNSIQIKKVIGTDAAAFSYFALEVAPEATVAEGGSVDRLLETIQLRLAEYLPELRPVRRPRSRRVQPTSDFETD